MRLTIESFVFVGMPNARHSQGQLAGAVRSATPTMIELFDDFLDILIELHLGEHHGIALSIKDFVLKDEFEDDGGYTIHPLQLAEIDPASPLMIVNCHYEMASGHQMGGLNFDVSPDSITFHLFEAAAAPTS